MKLSSMINPRLIFLDHQFNTYQDILLFICDKFSDIVNIPSSDILEALNRRENLGTTFLGHELALPHGYIDKIDDIYVLFIRLNSAMMVSYENRYNRIKYIFAVLTSTKKAHTYLKVLSAIAQMVTTNSYILDNAKNGHDLIETLEKKQFMVDEELTAKNLIFVSVSIDSKATVSEAVDKMKFNNITFLPVINESDELIGIIDLADIFAATFTSDNISSSSLSLIQDLKSARELIFEPIQHFWENEEKVVVGDIMRDPENYIISENGSYADIVLAMTKYHHRYLIVVDKNKHVEGMVDTDDIVHKMIRV